MRAMTVKIGGALPFLAATAMACFGSSDFGDARATAVSFARALQAGDTARMRRLSLPAAGTRVVQLRSELPPAYLAFAAPERTVMTIEGGGIYGSGAETVFRIPSTRLRGCAGGLELAVVKLRGNQRISAMRPVPSIDALSGAECRGAVADTAGGHSS